MNGAESVISIVDGPVSSAMISGSESSLTLRPATYCGDGERPSVSLASERIAVMVHESQGRTELQHCVGILDSGGTIAWGKHQQYAKGANPSVSANEMWMAIAVFESHDNRLFYKYGIINPETKDVTWGKSYSYGRGEFPAVALRIDGKLVEVHEEKQLFRKGLYYRLGRLDIDKRIVNWEEPVKIGKGKNAKVAVNDEGLVLMVHEHDTATALCYTVGELKDNAIEWGKTHYYDVGTSPCVCFKNWSSQIVEAHQDVASKTLQYRTGVVNATQKIIEWHPDKYKVHKGKSPSIAAGDNWTLVSVQVEASDSLACSVGSISKLQ